MLIHPTATLGRENSNGISNKSAEEIFNSCAEIERDGWRASQR